MKFRFPRDFVTIQLVEGNTYQLYGEDFRFVKVSEKGFNFVDKNGVKFFKHQNMYIYKHTKTEFRGQSRFWIPRLYAESMNVLRTEYIRPSEEKFGCKKPISLYNVY